MSCKKLRNRLASRPLSTDACENTVVILVTFSGSKVFTYLDAIDQKEKAQKHMQISGVLAERVQVYFDILWF